MSDKKVRELQEKICREIEKKQSKIVRYIDVTEHAKIVRTKLKKAFPNLKFRVISERFAGGTSVTVYHVGEITKKQEQLIQKFVEKFDGYGSDLLDGRYNVGFLHNGECIAGASFCLYNYKWCR
ncbi:MAG: hypothetical protein PHT40_04725 [Patescibacteria group bacterium]|nr:hypothetical protein [Patescibacteria group bacterium]